MTKSQWAKKMKNSAAEKKAEINVFLEYLLAFTEF